MKGLRASRLDAAHCPESSRANVGITDLLAAGRCEMANILPKPDPKSIAAKLAAEVSQCPVPATHDRRSSRLPPTTGRWLQTKRGQPSILSADPRNRS